MASLFQTNGLTLNVYEPPWRASKFLRNYSDKVRNYSHNLAAVGGFLSADFDLIEQPFTELEDWVENGLGREVKILTGSGSSVFEGFIDRLEFTVEGFHVSYGPMMDVGNKVALTFSMIDMSTGSPVTGMRGISDWVEDKISQFKYGILIKVLSSGGIQLEVVDEIVNLALKKISKPPKSEDLSFGSGASAFSLRMSLQGWGAFLNKYPYNNTGYSWTTVGDKIKAIVAAEPNGIFRTGLVSANALAVTEYENDNALAWGILKGLLSYGDTSFNRYILGTYENRNVVYRKVEDIFTYYRPLRESLTSVLNDRNQLVDPWLVRPGYWVKIQDLMPTARHAEPFAALDAMFIESVGFKEPNGLTLNGSTIYKLDQRLAQLGISGLGF